MRNFPFLSLLLALFIVLPAQAKHVKHPAAPTKAVVKVAVVAPVPPAPLARNVSSTKITRSFLPPTPKVAAKTKVAAKPALIVQAKPVVAPTSIAPTTTTATAADGSTPVINQALPKGALARITAYWTNEDYYTSQHMSSTGVHLKEGHCAVDPKLIPYGSMVQIPGMGSYVAVDTGSAVVSRQAALGSARTPDQRNALVVDLFFETRHEADEFAAHGPAFVSVSWKKPLTATDSPQNPRALPATDDQLAQTARVQVYVLASAPSLADSRLPMNFRSPVVFQ